jgi:hypothetical protein
LGELQSIADQSARHPLVVRRRWRQASGGGSAIASLDIGELGRVLIIA